MGLSLVEEGMRGPENLSTWLPTPSLNGTAMALGNNLIKVKTLGI